jgi:hypothetical protein
MANVHDLADELLLHINSFIVGEHRNTYLVNISLASRRLCHIAQEGLIC